MIGKITEALKTFAKFNQCPDIIIKKSNNRQYLKAIKEGL
jgi:hypothetical protein